MSRLVVAGGRPLQGTAEVPPDKSVLHRALILGALGRGRARVAPLGSGADNRSTLEALRSLGVRIAIEGDAAVVEGVEGPPGFRAPADPIDCGNSGTTFRLLTGILAAAPGLRVTLDGDASLRRRPMGRLRPLEAMGARLEGLGEGDLRPPMTVHGAVLRGARHELPVASAQVKSALLLAGLYAGGPTTVVEPRTSRDHTERMLLGRGVRLSRETTADGAHVVTVEPLRAPWALAETPVPPDVSSACFLFAAAAVTGGDVRVATGTNPTRTGGLDALERFGVELARGPAADLAGEPVAEVRARAGALRGHRIEGEASLRAVDELPVLAGVGLFAEGETTIADAAELKVKESDRIASVAAALRAFGGEVDTRDDGLVVRGGTLLHPGVVDAAGDHRIAMTAAVVALGIEGESVIEGADVIGVSFPGFVDTLRALGASVRLA